MRNKNTKRRKKQTKKESEKRSQSPFFVFGVTLTFLWSTHTKKSRPVGTNHCVEGLPLFEGVPDNRKTLFIEHV
jgi:hypothetical protein